MTDAIITTGLDSTQVEAGVRRSVKSLNDLRDAAQRSAASFNQSEKKIAKHGEKLNANAEAVKSLSNELRKSETRTNRYAAAVDASTSSIRKSNSAFSATEKRMQRYNDQLAKNAKAVRSATTAYERAERRLNKLDARVRGYSKTIKEGEKESGRYSEALRSLARSVQLVDGPLGGVAYRFTTFSQILKDGHGSLATFTAGLTGAALATTSLAVSGDKLTQLQNRLSLVTDGQQDLINTQRRLVELARETRVGLRPTIELFTKLSLASEKVNASQQDILDVTKALNIGVALSGSAASSAEAALLQLSQAIQSDFKSGVAQELNSVIEQIPRVAVAIQKGLGYDSWIEVKNATKDGLVSVEAFIQALKSQLPTLQTELAGTNKTVSQSFGELKDSVVVAIGSIDHMVGFSAGLAQTISHVAENVDLLIASLVALSTGIATRFALGAAVKGLSTFRGTLAATTLAAGQAAGAFATFKLAVSQPIGSLKTFSKWLVTLLSSLNPVRIAITLLGTAVSVTVYNILKSMTRGAENAALYERALFKVKGVLKETGNAGESAATGVDQTTSAMKRLLAQSKDAQEAFIRIVALNKTIERLENQRRTSNKTTQLIEKNKKELEVYKGFLSALKKDLIESDKLSSGVPKGVTSGGREKGVDDKVKALADIVRETRTPLEQFTEKVKFLESLEPFAKTAEQKDALKRAFSDAKVELEKSINKSVELSDTMKNVAKEINSAFSDMFENLIEGGELSSKSIGESFSKMVKSIGSKLASVAFTDTILAPTVSVIGSGLGINPNTLKAFNAELGASPNTASGLGSISNISSIFSSRGAFFNSTTANAVNSALLPSGFIGPAAPTFLGSTLGAASSISGIGAGLVGNLAANAIFGGDRGIGASIGGTAGSLGGAALATVLGATGVGIPLAVLAGAFGGNFLGGLFGGKQGTKASEFEATTGLSSLTGVTLGSKRAGTEFADGLSKAISPLVLGLNAIAGIDVSGISIRGGSNTVQAGGGFFDVGGQRITFDESSQSSTDSAIGKVIVKLLELSDVANTSVATALENIVTEGRSTAEILGDINFAAVYDSMSFLQDNTTPLEAAMKDLAARAKEATETAIRLGLAEEKVARARDKALKDIQDSFNQSVRLRILDSIDPASANLLSLDQEFAQLRRDAIAVSGDLIQVEQLYMAERKAILEENLSDQRDSIVDNYRKTLADIQGLRDSIALSGTLSGSNRLGIAREAQSQFDRLRAGISSGDPQAFKDLNDTTKAYLEASLDYYGPTAEYMSRLEDVYRLLDTAKTVTEQQFTIEEQALSESRTQTDLLRQLVERGDKGGLGNLYGISDSQLLRSTESASLLDTINPLTGLTNRLDRQLKISASGGSFDFGSDLTFGQSVRGGNSAMGQSFLDMLYQVGVPLNARQDQARAFGLPVPQFYNGTGASMYRGSAIVGERGAELVEFKQPARVYSNVDSSALTEVASMARDFSAYRVQSAQETSALISEIQALRNENQKMRDDINALTLRAR